MSLKLFGYWRSSSTWRVRWALELRGFSYIYHPINLLAGEQKTSAYLQINPSGNVPYLQIDSSRGLSQSLAQIAYLDSHPGAQGKKLIPEGDYERAKILELWEIIAADTQPLQNLSVQKLHSSDLNEQKKWNKHFILRGLNNYDKSTEKCRAEFSFGNNVSLADLDLIPQIYNALRFDVEVAKLWPSLWRIYERCLLTSECQKAAPDAQPDAQKP